MYKSSCAADASNAHLLVSVPILSLPVDGPTRAILRIINQECMLLTTHC